VRAQRAKAESIKRNRSNSPVHDDPVAKTARTIPASKATAKPAATDTGQDAEARPVPIAVGPTAAVAKHAIADNEFNTAWIQPGLLLVTPMQPQSSSPA
jgi:hypothetical protein